MPHNIFLCQKWALKHFLKWALKHFLVRLEACLMLIALPVVLPNALWMMPGIATAVPTLAPYLKTFRS